MLIPAVVCFYQHNRVNVMYTVPRNTKQHGIQVSNVWGVRVQARNQAKQLRQPHSPLNELGVLSKVELAQQMNNFVYEVCKAVEFCAHLYSSMS